MKDILSGGFADRKHTYRLASMEFLSQWDKNYARSRGAALSVKKQPLFDSLRTGTNCAGPCVRYSIFLRLQLRKPVEHHSKRLAGHRLLPAEVPLFVACGNAGPLCPLHRLLRPIGRMVARAA